jgi:hypothetical protein
LRGDLAVAEMERNMTKTKKWLSALVVGVLAMGLGGFVATQATATEPENHCTEAGEGWLPKVNNNNDDNTVHVEAPEGFLIDMYCVKAGNDENAKQFVDVDPPAAEVDIDHAFKDSVSHYQIHVIPVPDEDTPVAVLFNVEPTVATCEADGTLDTAVFPLEREGYTLTVDREYDGPGVYTITATAADGYEFEGEGDLYVRSVEVTVDAQLTDPIACPTDIDEPPAPLVGEDVSAVLECVVPDDGTAVITTTTTAWTQEYVWVEDDSDLEGYWALGDKVYGDPVVTTSLVDDEGCEPGDDTPPPADDDTPPPATPVEGSPSFTG